MTPEQRRARNLPYCIVFLPFFDEVWFLTTGQLMGVPVIFAEFSKR